MSRRPPFYCPRCKDDGSMESARDAANAIARRASVLLDSLRDFMDRTPTKPLPEWGKAELDQMNARRQKVVDARTELGKIVGDYYLKVK